MSEAGHPAPSAFQAQVLAALRAAGKGACSGETLSSALGVSRAAVWKHVEALRGLGYRIEGEPGGGYRLAGAPDRLFPVELHRGLETRWLGRTIHWLDQTDSTNRVALELARSGAEHGSAVIAEGQSAGRGRLGRSFFSPPYLNLYTSIVLRPTLALADAPTLILTAGVAVAEAVAETVGRDDAVELKWPNDVLLGGLKTSGILMELGAEGSRIAFLVLGIGVNLNVERERFPDDFRSLATSLRSFSGASVDRLAFVRRMYHGLETLLDLHAAGGFQAVRPRFERRFAMRGRAVRVRDATRGPDVPGAGGPADAAAETAGLVEGIDADGALVLRGPDGTRTRVVAGDVTIVKPPGGEGGGGT